MVSLGILVINQVKGRHFITTSAQHRYYQRRAVLHLATYVHPCAVLASGDKACLRRSGTFWNTGSRLCLHAVCWESSCDKAPSIVDHLRWAATSQKVQCTADCLLVAQWRCTGQQMDALWNSAQQLHGRPVAGVVGAEVAARTAMADGHDWGARQDAQGRRDILKRG